MDTIEKESAVPQEQFDVDNAENTLEPTVEQDFTVDDEAGSQTETEEPADLSPEGDEENAGAFDLTMFFNKTKSEIADLLEEIMKSRPVQTLRREVEAAKVAFYKVYNPEIEEIKKEFVAAGKAVEEFVAPVDAEFERFKVLLSEYRKARDKYIAESEQHKEENYKKKLKIIEDLKELVNSNETLNHTFAAFRELQNAWKEAGAVPQTYIKDLWETYHLHVENFYNFIKINNELRDLDLKRNTEIKLELCEEAEKLLLDSSVVSSFNKLQKLHERWRETGPVSNEYKEQLWERFKDASSKINKRHQEYFEVIKAEQKRNLDLKAELCTKVEELLATEYTTKAGWDKASETLMEIQKLWKTIGFAPKKDNTRIYERFRSACDSFFELKREFYSGLKGEMEANLQAKIELCELAEALQDSTDWKRAADELILLQKRWKEAGAVSRKHSDAVWKRFRKACDTFFNRKSEQFSENDAKFEANLALKQQLMDEIRNFVITEREESFEALKAFQRRWAEIGFVPIKAKEKLQNEYRKIIDAHFTKLKGDDKERNMERFKDKISSLKDKNRGAVKSERERLITKVRQLEADVALLENNIGFFAKSKNAEAMIRDVNDKIAKAKEEMAMILEKIKMIENQGE